jgi:hypothetical protein
MLPLLPPLVGVSTSCELLAFATPSVDPDRLGSDPASQPVSRPPFFDQASHDLASRRSQLIAR